MVSSVANTVVANSEYDPMLHQTQPRRQPRQPQDTVYVFVFAHPDDESMFFLPTIRSLVDAGETVWFLCLTTGNFDGLGKVREKEMERAGALLGASRVIVRNDDEEDTAGVDSSGMGAFLDHPTRRYDKAIVARAIRESLSMEMAKTNSNRNADDDCGTDTNALNPRRAIEQEKFEHYHKRFVLVTFDAKGVSGHVNHTDVYLGVVHLMEEEQNNAGRKMIEGGPTPNTTIRSKDSTRKPAINDAFFSEAWYLESEPNIVFKYVPVVSWLLLLVSVVFSQRLTSTSSVGFSTRVFRMHDPRLNWAAMATHHSQFVWYRRLFVVFSCYTYYNKLVCKKQPAR